VSLGVNPEVQSFVFMTQIVPAAMLAS